MEERAINSIEQFVHERSRLCFPGRKRFFFKSRLEERLVQLNLPDLAAYLNVLATAAGEEAELMDLLTTNETFFFRNPNQFRFLMETIIPSLEEKKGREVIRSWGKKESLSQAPIMKLRILCAGCSTGEEPYSVAMALLEALRYPRAWDIEIMAGDLSERCIKIAVAGYYEDERLKGLPAEYLQKYLERTAGGAVINDEVKRLVRFCPLNLSRIIDGECFPGVEVGSGGFDLIFCRNVMIYFSAETQQQLVDVLYHSLAPGGYLFTGDAEALHIYDHDFQPIHDTGCLIYKKMEML
jgi:chemotaxis protein methyltransferase CheR